MITDVGHVITWNNWLECWQIFNSWGSFEEPQLLLFFWSIILCFFFFYCYNLFIFLFFLILFFNFTVLYWFCPISTWIHHRYTRVPHPESSSHLPPCTIPLGRPSAPAPSIQYRASNLDWQLVSYMILYMFFLILRIVSSLVLLCLPQSHRGSFQYFF